MEYVDSAVSVASLAGASVLGTPSVAPLAGISRSVSKHVGPRRKEPLEYLNWIFLTMMLWLVYASIASCGLGANHGGLSAEMITDNRLYLDTSSTSEVMTPVSIRMLTVLREYALPSLFWVAGAKMSLVWEGSPPWCVMLHMAAYAACGIAINTALWMLGPGSPDCDPISKCPGQGILFDFTITPHLGFIVPLFTDMWFPMGLVFVNLLNWPLFASIHDHTFPVRALVAQWCITSALFIVLFLGAKQSGFHEDHGVFSCCLLIIYEGMFLLTASLSGVSRHDALIPWLPNRALQYLAATSLWLMVAGVPLTAQMRGLTPVFMIYLFVIMNKFFALGFMMATESSQPILSRYWPVMVAVLFYSGPSTNFYLAGNLIYPFFPHSFDRSLYALGALVALFFVDRIGRFGDSIHMPNFLYCTVLILFLLHPVFAMFLIKYGMQEVYHIMFLCIVFSLAISIPLTLVLFGASGFRFDGKAYNQWEETRPLRKLFAF